MAQARALLPHEHRAARTAPLLGGSALGVVTCAVPAVFDVPVGPGAAAVLLFLSAAVGVAGVGFALEDPSAPTTGLCPSPRWLRRCLRTTSALSFLSIAWWSEAALVRRALPAEDREIFPYGDLAVTALALSLLAMTCAMLTTRFTQGRGSGPAATALFASCVLLLLFLPPGIELFSDPADPPRWQSASQRWTALALLLAPATVALHGDPAVRQSLERGDGNPSSRSARGVRP
ncbi:hypothetical protein [Streptomyces sp. NPDC014894]|uniref:hypothetical protein n=1 Tax=Streptomyces sp. NPDC014894 TaxID=3364931 RepID=UPI0036F57B25